MSKWKTLKTTLGALQASGKQESMEITLPCPFCSCEAWWGGNPRCQQVGSVVTHWQQEAAEHGSTKTDQGFRDWPSEHVTRQSVFRNHATIRWLSNSWSTQRKTTIALAVEAQLDAAVAAAGALSAPRRIHREGCARLQRLTVTTRGQCCTCNKEFGFCTLWGHSLCGGAAFGNHD